MKTASAANFVAAILLAASFFMLGSCSSMRMPPENHDLQALDNPDIIERGRYLVYGPAHCAACHGEPERENEMRQGTEIRLSGGRSFDLGPLGTIVAPNITSDAADGIGALSDETLIRALRYGIARDGRPLAPFMPFAGMADDDLRAILSFLRSLPPVAATAPPSDLSWLGAFGIKFLLDPHDPTTPPPSSFAPARTAEYGRYLAYSVANCHDCHTLRSRLTGAFIGAPFAGGMQMKETGGTFLPPNLTPIATGIMHDRTEQEFIQHFRLRGRDQTGSPMPWSAFARMTDTDLGAIYQYLITLPPTETPDA